MTAPASDSCPTQPSGLTEKIGRNSPPLVQERTHSGDACSDPEQGSNDNASTRKESTSEDKEDLITTVPECSPCRRYEKGKEKVHDCILSFLLVKKSFGGSRFSPVNIVTNGLFRRQCRNNITSFCAGNGLVFSTCILIYVVVYNKYSVLLVAFLPRASATNRIEMTRNANICIGNHFGSSFPLPV